MIKKMFILSTKAGSGDFHKLKEKILETYNKHNKLKEIEIIVTQDKNHGKRAAYEFSNSSYPQKLLIACGGDGTAGEIAGILRGTDTAMSLIPMGTGNDFSKNFDYSKFKIEDTIEPVIKPIDLIDVNGRTCINVMSIGFDTHILKRAYDILDLYPRMGKRAFALAVIKSLANIRNENLELYLKLENGGEEKFAEELIISVLCNGGYYGSGFNPSPGALIDDGVLNLLTVNKLTFLTMLPLILKYKKGQHIGNINVKEYKVTSGQIKSRDEAIANIDGEIFKFNEINFKIVKEGLLWGFIVPFKSKTL